MAIIERISSTRSCSRALPRLHRPARSRGRSGHFSRIAPAILSGGNPADLLINSRASPRSSGYLTDSIMPWGVQSFILSGAIPMPPAGHISLATGIHTAGRRLDRASFAVSTGMIFTRLRPFRDWRKRSYDKNCKGLMRYIHEASSPVGRSVVTLLSELKRE